MSGTLDTAAFAAGACALGGLLVPGLVARIPEPADEEPEDDPADHSAHDAGDPTGVRPRKVPYAAIAAGPGLAVRTAGASAAAGGLVGASLGWAWPLLYLLPLVPVGVALAVVDWRTRLLPTGVIARTYVVIVALVLACAAITRDVDDLVRAGWGWLVAGGLVLDQRGRRRPLRRHPHRHRAGDLHRGWVWRDGEAATIRDWDVRTELEPTTASPTRSPTSAPPTSGPRARAAGRPPAGGRRAPQGRRAQHDRQRGPGPVDLRGPHRLRHREYLHQLDEQGRPLVPIE